MSADPWFIRNEDGRGFRAADKRARVLFVVWDIASWAFAAFFVWTFFTWSERPWWIYVLASFFAAAPFVVGMILTGLGPIEFLRHLVRLERGKAKP